MSSIGIERGMAGLPALPVEYVWEVDSVETEVDFSTSGASPTAGVEVLRSNPIPSDGTTIFEIEASFVELGGATQNSIVSLWETVDGVTTDLGILLRTFGITRQSAERSIRRVVPAGLVVYSLRLWCVTGGTVTLSSGAWGVSNKNPGRLTVRQIKRGTS